MSRIIDERVVEMRFDNKQFEANAKESIGTLSRLKEALNISTKDSAKSLDALNSAAKNISLDGIAAGVEALQKRFSTLGIVGMRVIENITDSMMNTLGRATNYITDSIVSGGIRRAMNIENAHFQLQALLKDEEKVQAVMDDAMKSVDGTAYAYDEAAKAASQFAASGLEAGEEMLNALRGIVGVSAMTNSEFSSISQIFTTVAGNGRLMGDQLLQLGSRGLNAAATIADFVNGVTDGSKEASAEVKTLVKNITDGAKVTQADIREAVSDGQISFKLFSEAMTDAFADSAERANETFTGALSNIKSALARIGAGFISPLVAQNSEVVGLFNAVRERINDVKKALVFDEELGNVHALSKQFTDAVLLMAKGASEFIRDVDLSVPMSIFYHGVETIKNLAKGLYTVLKPLGQAFSEVFLWFSADDVENLASKIERLTSYMQLTDVGAKELKDAFKGLFNVAALVGDIFIDLVRIFIPMGDPLNVITGGVFGLAGAIGRSLTTFTQWFRTSETIGKVYNTVSNMVANAMHSFSSFMLNIPYYANKIYELEPVQELLGTLSGWFDALGKKAIESGNWIGEKILEVKENILSLIPVMDEEGLMGVVSSFATSINNTIENLRNLDLSKPKDVFNSFKNVLKSLLEVLKGNEGLNTFVTNMKKFFTDLGAAFSIDTIIEKIDTFRNKVDEFVVWIRNLLEPLANIFSDFSFGGAVAAGGGLGMIYAIVKMAKSFEQVANTIVKIPEILGAFKGVLTEYQRNLKADSLKKVAAAILMLSGALVLLSFADIDRVLKAAVSLSLVAGVLLAGVNKFIDVAKKTKTVDDATYMFAKAANNLTKSVKWKAIGSTFKDFGAAILMVVGSIIAVALAYRKDPEAVMMAADIVEYIAGAMIVMVGVMSLIGKILGKGMSSFSKAAAGVLFLSASLGIIIGSMNRLFKMEIPADYQFKMDMLKGLFIALAGLTLVIGASSFIAGSGKVEPSPILSLAAGLYVSVLALNKLFRLELPRDYEAKMDLLKGLFNALAGLMLVIGVSSWVSGGNGFKGAFSAILAMCVFIGTAVASLIVLSIFPAERMIQGATALGILLGTLALALLGAGQVATKEAYKAVLAMAVGIGAIVLTLGVLSMVPVEKLFKAGVALGSMLLILASDFAAIGQIKNKDSYLSILSMVAAVVAIGASLSILSQYPWDSLLAAGAALSGTLLALSGAMTIVSTAAFDTMDILAFVAGAVALIPIGYSLSLLAGNDWSTIWPAMVALAGAVLVLSGALILLSVTPVNLAGILAFVAGAVALVPIAHAMSVLTGLSWQDVATGLITLAGALTIIGVSGLVLGPISPLIIALSAALMIFGVSITAVGASLVLFVSSLLVASELIQRLPKAFQDTLYEFYEVGANIIRGIINGILDGLEALWETVKGVAQGVLSIFGIELETHSPSKATYRLGIFTDQGLANGLTDGSGEVETAVGSVVDGILGKIKETELYSSGKNLIGEFGQGIASEEGNVGSAAGEALSAAAKAVNMTDFRSSGEQASNEFIEGLGSDNVMDVISSYGNVDGLDLTNFFSAGEAGSNEFLNGFSNTDFDFSSMLGGSAETTDLTSFNLTGEQASTEFMAGFQNGSNNSVNDAATEVVRLFCEAILSSFEARIPEVTTEIQTQLMVGLSKSSNSLMKAGSDASESWIKGVKLGYPMAIVVGMGLATKTLDGIKTKDKAFQDRGKESANYYIQGVKDQFRDAELAGEQLAESVMNGLQKIDFSSIGEDAGKGLIDGISSMKSSAEKAGAALGNAVYESSKKALDEHSPSRKMAEVGEFAGLGFVSQLMYFIAKAADAGEDLGDATIKGASDAISNISRVITDDMLADPVITPVVDLSNIRKSAEDISRLFNQAIAITVDNASSVSGTIRSSRARKIDENIQNQKETPKQTVFNFEQNNYSPKALNSIEIYRQTRNQISIVKGAMSR